MSIKGSIGNIHDNILHGWAFDENDLNTAVTLEVFYNNQIIYQVTADHERKDFLNKEIHPTGRCGFRIPIDQLQLVSGEVSILKIRNKIDHKELHNSPFIIDSRSFNNRILIVGLNKSGTSILAYRVAAGLGTKKIHFEPLAKEGLNNIEHQIKLTHKDDIVTKCLFHLDHSKNLKQIASLYDKKIWIYRDPRDVMISSFFYTWYKGHNPSYDTFKIALERTKAKEENPLSISFSELSEGIININGFVKNRIWPVARKMRQLDKSWFLLKYENFMDGLIEELNTYLGFEIDTTAEVSQSLNRVKRSSSYGNWRSWFTSGEIELMKEVFNPILEELNYDSTDWELNDNPNLDPEKGSLYMTKLFNG